jgi:squalene-hopene/tetraprenyl-beta-curcumene cyclase
LWFGNEGAPGQENPTFGTSRVLSGLAEFHGEEYPHLSETGRKGIAWVLDVQGSDGGWGGGGTSPPSIEETAVAVDALAKWHLRLRSDGERSDSDRLNDAVSRGCEWLIERTGGGENFEPAPIGLYFAKLWYYERLYPVIFTLGALGRVLRAGL